MRDPRLNQARLVAGTVLREPFHRRAWSELVFFLISGVVAWIGIVFVAATLASGAVLAVTFVGVVIIAACLRGVRGIGGWHRALARHFLDERIADPEPFRARSGMFGWLQAALRDRTAWRALAYTTVKIPLLVFSVWFGLSIWADAFASVTYPVLHRGVVGPAGFGVVGPAGFGVVRHVVGPDLTGPGPSGALHGLLLFVTGVALFFFAPWALRLVVYLDRRLMRLLLGPDAMTARVRTLEQTRAQTVDASAATLRRIERDLHDGTQAQLVALAMRLGRAKEKLAAGQELDLDQVRRLVDEAHRGAKEAIVELRDLARGIHPPVLDTGLEGALATLAARSAVPSELTVSIQSRPTPAMEAIAYFCVAELLANAAQHAQASRATISCTEHGPWLRIVVRDDGRGGAVVTRVGSTSSGLAGLTDRVEAVDGHLGIASPPGGPTVVSVDLPCHP
ncbi:MAG TPA: sensor domain-containing protein [Acidimicrobiales bacterium]|jgi:signal transduction histidine kinase|nr:sensor domain-containing protein [Acidimicrobiales bacterium]